MPAKKKSGKTPKKAPTAKAKKQEMQQTHAKEEKFQPTTLDQIWGDTGLTKYGHLDQAKYEQELKAMTKSDIQSHAHFVGIIPIDNREQLEKRLVMEFQKYASSFAKPSTTQKSHPEISDEGLRILREGR